MASRINIPLWTIGSPVTPVAARSPHTTAQATVTCAARRGDHASAAVRSRAGSAPTSPGPTAAVPIAAASSASDRPDVGPSAARLNAHIAVMPPSAVTIAAGTRRDRRYSVNSLTWRRFRR